MAGISKIPAISSPNHFEQIPKNKFQIPTKYSIDSRLNWNLEFVFWNLKVVRNLN